MPESGQRELRGAERAAFVADAARRAFVLDSIPNLSKVPELFREPPESIYVQPYLLRDDLVLHVIGIHEPAARDQPIRVAVDSAARRVVLLLSAYRAVVWDVQVEDGATLAGVYLVGHEPS